MSTIGGRRRSRCSSCCRRSTSAADAWSACGRATSTARWPTRRIRSPWRRGSSAQGATWLHVVDLDGARDGEPRQLDTAAEVVAEVHGRARVELGGGLRTAVAVAGAIGTGAAARSRSAPAALTRSRRSSARSWRATARSAWSPSIDVRDGVALGEGWRQDAVGLPAAEAIEMLAAAGVDDVRGDLDRARRPPGGPGPRAPRGRWSPSARAGSSRPAGSPRSTTCSRSRRSAARARSSAARCTRAGSTSAPRWPPSATRVAAPADGAPADRARACGQCPSACSFLCASTILSARCDGTSS